MLIENMRCLTDVKIVLAAHTWEFSNLSTLQFRNNKIAELHNIFPVGLVNVHTLSLTGCFIERIHADAFVNLVNLVHLNLRTNTLHVLEPGLFRNNSKLSILSLSDNKFVIFDEHSNSLPGVLDELDLSQNRLSSICNLTFDCLTKLNLSANRLTSFANIRIPYVTHLDLSANYLTELKCLSFGESLEHLNLKSNLLRTMDASMFAKAHSLKKMCLCQNNLKRLPDNLFANLFFLSDLCLDQNRIGSIDDRLLRNCRSLRYLSIDANFVETIDDFAFAGLVRLKCFRLRFNQNRKNSNEFAIGSKWFANNRQLQKLYLNNSRFRKIEENAFENLAMLQVLDLSANAFDELPVQFLPHGSFRLVQLLLHDNPFTNSKPFRLRNVTGSVAFRSIKQLRLPRLRFDQFDEVSFRATSIKRIQLNVYAQADIGFDRLLFDFSRIINLRFLHLSGSDLRVLFWRLTSAESEPAEYVRLRPQSLFQGPNLLKQLFMSRCSIDRVPDRFFENLSCLSVLDLSHNRLQSLDRCLQPLSDLLILNLETNRFREFRDNPFFFNSRLKRIDLRNNEITWIDFSFFDHMPVRPNVLYGLNSPND